MLSIVPAHLGRIIRWWFLPAGIHRSEVDVHHDAVA